MPSGSHSHRAAAGFERRFGRIEGVVRVRIGELQRSEVLDENIAGDQRPLSRQRHMD